MLRTMLTVAVRNEQDVIASRLRARQIAAQCGFGVLDQARIATAVSELARNVFNYASSGIVRFSISDSSQRQALFVAVEDEGPGINGVDDILAGHYRSTTGMGLGILSARRLMETCEIVTGKVGGTRITVSKALPLDSSTVDAAAIERMVARLDALPSNVALSEANQQNRELTNALSDLQARQEELLLVTGRLEETNRRMEALNALLDEKALSLVNADRRKDEFLAVLSHELRGPLSAAGMAARLLQDGTVPERSAQLGDVVARQVGHMSRLVEDLLDVSRFTRGLVMIQRVPVDLNDVVRDAVEQVGPAAASKQHELAVSLPEGPCLIEGDRTRLIQVLGNLLGNAIRYTPKGGRIGVTLAMPGGGAVLEVADNGIGLAPEFMPHLFDLYVQAEHSPERSTGGLGLGLALVKSLVDAHGGTVSAASEGKGLGSSFLIAFPVCGAGRAVSGATRPS